MNVSLNGYKSSDFCRSIHAHIQIYVLLLYIHTSSYRYVPMATNATFAIDFLYVNLIDSK